MCTYRDDQDGEQFSRFHVAAIPVEEQAHSTDEMLHTVVQAVEGL